MGDLCSLNQLIPASLAQATGTTRTHHRLLPQFSEALLLMAQATQELIDTLLREQDLEFSTEFSHVNHPLAAAICDTPEAELLAAGEELIESDAASRRILGIRLLRELKRPARQAAADLARLMRRENDDDVVYWIVSAFEFLRGDLVAGEPRRTHRGGAANGLLRQRDRRRPDRPDGTRRRPEGNRSRRPET
jgi:hypothetical protein